MKPMSSTLAAPHETGAEHELPHARLATPVMRTRQSQPAPGQGARWWFVFDRWLPVTDATDGQEDFVLA